MNPFVQLVTNVLSLGILILDILIVLGFAALLFLRNSPNTRQLFQIISRYGLGIGFLISLGSVLGSMFYSDYAGFLPCELCWWMRIFMFPQVLLFGGALYEKWRKGIEPSSVFFYSHLLAAVGAVIAFYNYYGQMFDPSVLPACEAVGASCAMIYFTTFGYITIPMMALTGFVTLILLFIVTRKANRI